MHYERKKGKNVKINTYYLLTEFAFHRSKSTVMQISNVMLTFSIALGQNFRKETRVNLMSL